MNQCPFEIIGKPQTVYRGKWIYVKEIRFKKPDTDDVLEWQCVHRTTTKDTTKPDGVDIIAKLKKNGKSFFVLIKQYRFPIDGMSLEFPAGLVDPEEELIEAGLRELKEETGYTATKVISCSRGKNSLDPGLSNDSVCFIVVEIDGDSIENQNPKQELAAGEVVLVECDKILEYINSISGSLNVEAMLYSFAVGYGMGHQSQ